LSPAPPARPLRGSRSGAFVFRRIEGYDALREVIPARFNHSTISITQTNFWEKSEMKSIRLIFAGILIGLIIGGAVTYSQGPTRRYIDLPTKTAQAPFSDGVLVGNTLYLAGRLGLDPKTNKIPEDIEQEIRLLLDGFKATLAEAGMTMDHLVSVTIYCPDLTLYDKFNGVYRTYFSKNMPARAFIGSGPLLRNAHFEMQAIAAK
jgi:reactive intermediate/imine deaminase